MIDPSGSVVIDETAGVRTDHVESLHLFVPDTPQINRPDRHPRYAVPRVRVAGNDGKFSGHAVFRQRVKRSDLCRIVVLRFAAERVEENHQAGDNRHEAAHRPDDERTSLFDEIAPRRLRRKFRRFHVDESIGSPAGPALNMTDK